MSVLKRQRSQDELLVRQLMGGSEKAFRKLFELYRDDIFSYSLALVRSKFVAEETVQEVFLKIWMNSKNLDPKLSFRSYLFTIARNHSFDFLRKAANNKKLREEIFYTGVELHDNTQDDLMDAEYELLKMKAIETMPPKRRLIYEMSRDEEMSYEDISLELGISIHTVKNQMSKALQSLKKYLQLHTDLTFLVVLLGQICIEISF